MNGKQLACVVLMMIIGAVTYAAQIVHKKAEAAIVAANDEKASADAAAKMAEIAKTTLEFTQGQTAELQRFLGAWTPIIQRMGSRQEVESAIQANAREKGIFVVNQRFEDKNNTGQRMMPRSVMANLIIEDEYSKVLNWLGDLEKKVPLARVNSCRLSSAATGRQIHMEVSMEVPLIDLNVNPLGVEVKKKK